MSNLGPFTVVRRNIKKAVPGAVAKIDPPLTASGIWFMDLVFETRRVVVQWTSGKKGFGVTKVAQANKDAYTHQPEEVLPTAFAAAARAAELLKEKFDKSYVDPMGR